MSVVRRCSICRIVAFTVNHPMLAGPICLHCLGQKSARMANTLWVGEADGEPAFSIEFEICSGHVESKELERALILLSHGYIRTEDETVDDEYKSPIYRSLAAFQSMLPVLDTLIDLVDSCCGTHIHVSCPLKTTLLTCGSDVFAPLIEQIQGHQERAEAFWGRYYVWGDWFNIATRYQTIEFRLPRFRTALQYLAVVRFCRAVGARLNAYLACWDAFVENSALPAHADLLEAPGCVGEELRSLYLRSAAQVQAAQPLLCS